MPVQTRRRPPSSREPAPAGRASASVVPPSRRGGGRGTDTSPKRKRRKDPLWARLTVVVGAVLMMTSGAAIVGSKALIGQATGSISQQNLLGDAGKSNAEGGDTLEGPIDMLLLGVDARATWAADDVRADSIIILHIPATHDQAYLISIPRDTEVQIPPFKKTGFGGDTTLINAAFHYGARNGGGWEGGAQLMAQTIKNATGVSFDGAAIINFGGFKKVIDALGTVRICVAQEVTSIHMSYVDGKPMWNADAKKTGKKRTPVLHKKGCREMEGWEALDYSRQRKTLANGDYDRQQNQQQLIKAMAKKAISDGAMTNPLKLRKLLDAAGDTLIIDTGRAEIADLVFTMRGVTDNELTMLRTNNGTFHVNEHGRESLSPLTMDMFKAVKEDKLAEFVFANPGVLSTRK
ncbi:cell envelope-related function transcriptional attenuator common domain-containing protein [Micromonospora pallida]|uniref:Cell envelope-related function transcriptional attenuator common domain-containing protein n=1 Tax=Micromonospora pallida TaxID=145854 RepID=A0A1C6TBK6_9ACTN|nr:LCP family protein [Micromonospora pallida]SCL39059.1 cell envelope-related function transcriptional attenuator common domain-containing protein [Micromonospora pallida]